MKAFDKVKHRKLLHKLIAYGFVERLVAWVNAFLIGRKQRVVFGEQSSSWCDVYSYVPQLSFLVPLLFILYINDLTDNLTHKFKLYADDETDQAKIVEWCKAWFSLEECKVMNLGKQSSHKDYFIAEKIWELLSARGI